MTVARKLCNALSHVLTFNDFASLYLLIGWAGYLVCIGFFPVHDHLLFGTLYSWIQSEHFPGQGLEVVQNFSCAVCILDADRSISIFTGAYCGVH